MWRMAAKRMSRDKRLSSSFLDKLTGNKYVILWELWRQNARLSKTAGAYGDNALNFLINRGLAQAWAKMWDEYRTNKAGMQKLKHAASKLNGDKAACMYYEWKAMAISQTRLKKFIGARMFNNVLKIQLNGMQAWRDAAKELSGRSTAMETAAKRMVFGATMSAWTLWLDTIRVVNRTKAMAARSMKSGNSSLLFKSWNTWRENAGDMAGQMHRGRKSLTRLLNRTLAEGMDRWRDAAAELSVQKQQLRRAANKMLNSLLAAGLAGWRDAAGEMLQQKNAARKALNMMTKRVLMQAWEDWLLTTVEQGGELIKMRHCMMRLQYLQLANAMSGWKEICEARNDTRRRMKDAVKKMMSSQLNSVLNTWLATTNWMAMSKEKMGQVLLRMMNRQQAMSFLHWHETAQDRKEMVASMKVYAGKIRDIGRTKCLNHWTFVCRAIKSQKFVLNKVIKRILNLDTARLFCEWHHGLVLSKDDGARVLEKMIQQAAEQELANLTAAIMNMKLNFLYSRISGPNE